MSEDISRMVIENAIQYGDPWVLEAYKEILDDFRRKRAKGQGFKKTSGVGYYKALKDYEKELIVSTIKESKGNVAEAARSLEINRTTLVMKMKQLGLHSGSVVIDEDGYEVGI